MKPFLIFSIACTIMICGPQISAQYTDSLSQKELQSIEANTSFPAIGFELKNFLSPDPTRITFLDVAFPLEKQGIFCRWEDQIIQKSRIPIKFRLGSLQYADGLEGKSSLLPEHSMARP